MPHKVNPIDFENGQKAISVSPMPCSNILPPSCPVSRLQRDLTDSTVLRNIGCRWPILLSIKSIEKGLAKLVLNEKKLYDDLEGTGPVVAEAIQTILRRENYPRPYEHLKD